jgi:hypothetical protein
MSNDPYAAERELRTKAEAGDLSACDELATLLYKQGRYEESATLYLRAVQGNFYAANPRSESVQNFVGMINSNLVPHNSPAATYLRERDRIVGEVSSRAYKAAGRAGIATFIGYLVVVFGGGVSGILRDYSLIIASTLAWLAWKLVLSTFESDA